MEFKKILISALLVTSASVHADSIGWGNGQGGQMGPGRQTQPTQPTQPSIPNDPWGNSRSGQGQTSQATQIVEENIQSYFDGQSRFDLVSDFYIRSQLQGSRIKDITVIASTENGNGLAAILLNGQSLESSKVIARQMTSYSFRVDPFSNVLGQSLRSIELGMQGRFYVEKVIFNLFENNTPAGPGPSRPPEGPRVEIIRQLVNQRIQQEGGLELLRIFNLGMERQGQVIKRVTIMARAGRGFAQASLLANNQQIGMSQSIGGGLTRLTFDLNQGFRIGQDLRGLRLLFRGDLALDEVSLEVESRTMDQRRDRDHGDMGHRMR